MSTIARLVHYKVESPIEISDSTPTVWVIENPHEFYDRMCELKSAFEGEEQEFVLLEGQDRLDFAKTGEMITDVLSLDFADKRMTTVLYKKLEQEAKDVEKCLLLNRLHTSLAEYYSALFDSLPLSLTFDDVTAADVLKVGKVRISETYASFLEKIVCYINAMVQLKGVKFFVFLHLKSVLSDMELKDLYHHCCLEKVGLLLVESNVSRGFLPEEKSIIVTDDLCEIVDKSVEIR